MCFLWTLIPVGSDYFFNVVEIRLKKFGQFLHPRLDTDSKYLRKPDLNKINSFLTPYQISILIFLKSLIMTGLFLIIK